MVSSDPPGRERADGSDRHRALRVLCVDDDDRIALQLRRALEALGRPFRLEHAATYDEARELLLSQHFCVAFVDLVLDPSRETDSEDWDGLRLIAEIADIGLLGHLSVVILSQFQRLDLARWALVRHHIKDYIVKSSGDTLKQQVAEVIANDRAYGLDCEVNLAAGLEWPTLLERISKGGMRSLTSRVTPETALVEMDHLLRQLFVDSRALEVSELSGGKTPTAVLRVTRLLEGGQMVRPAVVKIGEVERVEREQRGFEELSDYLSGMRSTRLEGYHRGVYLGALRYTLIGGGGGRLLPFGQYYVDTDVSKVQHTLTGLFRDTCGLFYEPRNRETAGRMDLVEAYRDYLGLDVAKLERGYEFKFGHPLGDHPTFVHRGLDVELPNAVLAFKDGRIELSTDSFLCPTHGDLHGDNLVVDPDDGGAWLIDFGLAGRSHWARDFALLECYLRYRLVQTSDLADLYTFEQALLTTGSLTAEPNFGALCAGELRHAGKVVRTIREAAAHAAQDHPTAFVEYQVALLMTSLLYMQLHALLTRKWRKLQVMMTAGCLLQSIRAHGRGHSRNSGC